MLEGLEVMHESGFAHRDIKPENVLVHDEQHFYLADFGFSAPISEMSRRPRCGTPGFVAPEVLVIGSSFNEKSDLFGLGALLYFVASGRYLVKG